ncbi:MAG: metalloregulator ArsR/SmtB family transcription factor [Gallionella sp.]|nr:metalloregulator ArsR/SmtB family transcription factor [Gallionella sp.]
MMLAMKPVFDVLSDASRRHILALLAVEGELCVCELGAALDDIQPKISRHLAILREAGWVAARREGSWIFYRLATMPTWGKQVVAALGQGGVPAAELSQSQQRLTCFTGRPVQVNKEAK